MRRRIRKTVPRPFAVVRGRPVAPNPTRSEPTRTWARRKRKLQKLARRANR